MLCVAPAMHGLRFPVRSSRRMSWFRAASAAAGDSRRTVLAAAAGRLREPQIPALALPKAGGPIPVSAPARTDRRGTAFWDQIAPARVIYIGETHNSNADHEYQFDVLKGLKARGVAVHDWLGDVRRDPAAAARRMERAPDDAPTRCWRRPIGSGTGAAHSVMYEKILRWSLGEGVSSSRAQRARRLSATKWRRARRSTPRSAPCCRRASTAAGRLRTFRRADEPESARRRRNLENFYKAQLVWEQTMATRIVRFPRGASRMKSSSCSSAAATSTAASACPRSSARKPTRRNSSFIRAAAAGERTPGGAHRPARRRPRRRSPL